MLHELGFWPDKLMQGRGLARECIRHYQLLLPKRIEKLVYIGMGGSGIAGTILHALLGSRSTIPYSVVQGTNLPGWIDRDTLSIVCTYSGSTWETLDHLHTLLDRNLPVILITNNALLITQMAARNVPCVLLPASRTPRSSLGHVLGFSLELCQQLHILPGTQLLETFLTIAQKQLPQLMRTENFDDFLHLVHNTPLLQIWGVTDDSAAYAYRTQTQLNENAKIPACTAYIPELCHNLLEGLAQPAAKQLGIVLMHTNRLQERIARTVITLEWLIKQHGIGVYKAPVLGDTYPSQFFYGLLWGDFASVHAGVMLGVDTVNVPIIQALKEKTAT